MAIPGLDNVRWDNVERWLPGLLAEALPASVDVTSRLEEGQEFPFVLVKEVPLVGPPHIKSALLRLADVELHCFAQGLDAEDDAYDLAVACEEVLLGLRGCLVTPSEKLAQVVLTEGAVRRVDWADSTGPVQYQDLPTQVERFGVSARLVVARRIT